MKKSFWLLPLLLSANFAQAASATLTVDNEYMFYKGNAAASNLTLIGSGSNWTAPNSFNFDVAPGDFLYVLAHDTGQPHAWQGVFSGLPVGTVYSNSASWVGASVGSYVPLTQSVVAGAAWGAINTDLAANSGPWGNRVGDANAHWIWTSGTYSSDVTVLFRTANAVAAVPEPEGYAMLIAGLGLMAMVARRKRA